MLQLVGSLFTVGLLLLLAWGIRGARGEGPTRLVLLLPFVLSMPVLYAGIWLLPDNAGWLGVLAVWLVALRPRFDAWTIAAGAVLLAALVFFRQIHIWPLAMLITCAWLGGSRDGSSFRLLDEWRAMTDRPLRRAARVALVLGAAVPAVAVLWWFSETWGGLTPPVFHERHVGGNPSAPAFVLAVFGSLGIFFAPFVLPELREAWRGQRWLPIAFATLGLGLGLLAPTTRDVTQGRYSGLWDLASLLPAPGGRSIVIVPLAAIGSVLLAGWFLALGRRDRWIMLAAIVAFTAAQCASFKLWQRYTEPMVLIWLALAAARVAPSHSGGEGWRFLGPAALACLLGLQTAASLVMARPVTPRALIAPWEERAPILPGMLDLEAADPDDGANPSGRSEEDRDP